MILCITPNPAIDRTVLIAGDEVHDAAGGKGVNVARAIAALGGRATSCGPIGGATGAELVALAAAEGLDGAWLRLEGVATRVCTMTVGEGAAVARAPGPRLSASQWDTFIDHVALHAGAADLVAICGSFPPGVDAEMAGDLIDAAGSRPVWVDTSGPALRVAAERGHAGLKVNRHEAAALVGAGEAPAVAIRLAALTGAPVVVTDEANGAALVHDGQTLVADAPAVVVRNATGSGDCFFGALLARLAAGGDHADALTQAVAAGSANAQEHTVRLDPDAVARLAAAVTVRRLVQRG